MRSVRSWMPPRCPLSCTSAACALLLLLLGGGCDGSSEETFASDDDASGENPTPGDDDSVQTGPTAAATADVVSGEIPLQVGFSASGSEAPAGLESLEWAFGDGGTGAGEQVDHTYLSSGEFTATLTVTEVGGAQATASVGISVQPGTCPSTGESVVTGTVASEAITEVSGVVESRQNPGVLWVHNDSGDTPRLFALSPEGTHLGIYDLPGAPSGDWEDLAIGYDSASGEHLLYVGDVGDNDQQREHVLVHVVTEPAVSAGQEPVEMELTGFQVRLTYPEGQAFDSETLAVDPVNGDIYLVTKVLGETFGVFRKVAPHQQDETVELELVAESTSEGLSSWGVTTGGEFSPLGDRFIVRGYGPTGRIWLRDGGVPLAETLAGPPCEVLLPVEQQAESVCFAADGQGLYTIPEGAAATIQYTPFEE